MPPYSRGQTQRRLHHLICTHSFLPWQWLQPCRVHLGVIFNPRRRRRRKMSAFPEITTLSPGTNQSATDWNYIKFYVAAAVRVDTAKLLVLCVLWKISSHFAVVCLDRFTSPALLLSFALPSILSDSTADTGIATRNQMGATNWSSKTWYHSLWWDY